VTHANPVTGGRKQSVEQVSQLQAEIRLVDLRAHLGMRDVLTADQISKYQPERGHAAEMSL
jgi:hypothetical protein